MVPDPPSGLTAVEPRLWTAVWARVIADPSVKNTGFALLTWADWKTGAQIHPGIPKLMQATGIKGDKTVRDALKTMRDWKFVWRYVEGSKAPYVETKNGRKRMSDEYRLTFPDDISGIPMYTPDWKDDDEDLWTTLEHRS